MIYLACMCLFLGFALLLVLHFLQSNRQFVNQCFEAHSSREVYQVFAPELARSKKCQMCNNPLTFAAALAIRKYKIGKRDELSSGSDTDGARKALVRRQQRNQRRDPSKCDAHGPGSFEPLHVRA